MFPFIIISTVTRKTFAYITSPLRSNNVSRSFIYMPWPVVLVQASCFLLAVTVLLTQVFMVNLNITNDLSRTNNYAQI